MISRKFSSDHSRNRRRRLPFESLECRHMLSSIGLNDDGIVEVQGTEDADEISVFVADGRFVVEVNGASTSFNNNDVDGLYVEAKGGDDNVRIDSTVLQPTLVFGGLDDDTIQGGVGPDVILGGSGDDTIVGNTANDILLGDGPNSLAEVPQPQPGEAALDSAANAPVVVDIVPVGPSDPDSDPLALHQYLSRISGINEGSDAIVGGTGHDMIFAGADNDRVAGDGPNVLPSDGISDATFTTDVVPADPEIIPRPANDYIEAGAGDDVVSSGPGADLVFGGGGNDTLNTGSGADIVVGGSGDDTINAGRGRDRVLGDGPNTINQAIRNTNNVYLANSALGSGNDHIEAGAGNDLVYTGDRSNAATNLVFGGEGDDTIFGGRGRDAIVGGADDDTIHSGAAADIVLGDSVNSLAELPDPQPGEPATVDLTAAAPLVADIATVDPNEPDPLALHRYLSRISGINAGRDTIVAAAGNDLVFAGAHSDSVEGDGANVYPSPVPTAGFTKASAKGTATVQPHVVVPPGDDYIEAGGGNDRVDAGHGRNIVFGGNGGDTLIGGAGSEMVIGGSGHDLIRTRGGADIVLGDGPGTINQVVLDSNDVYPANSVLGRGNDYIESGAGNDTVYAGRGRDAVFAGAGDDFAHGGRGDDLLVGGTGADTLIGGGGDDVIITGGPNFGPWLDAVDNLADALFNDSAVAGDQSNDYVEAGAGHDRVFAFGGHDLAFGGAGDDELRAGGGNDILVGGDGNDAISAGAGNDIALGDGPNSLDGAILPLAPEAAAFDAPADPSLLRVLLANSALGRGDDVIDGGAGNDLMFGGAGGDAIYGRAGNDLLHGGHGDDELYDDVNSGGDGVDVFVGDCGADKIFANDGPEGPVDFIYFDDDDELHVDGEDELIEQPPC